MTANLVHFTTVYLFAYIENQAVCGGTKIPQQADRNC